MSMNPQAEDFERLAIRWADAPHAAGEYPSMIAAITAFPELYAKNRDALPQNDADRAFALVARASLVLDRYMAAAETDQAAARLADEAARLVDEALKLDPVCYDAMRIRRHLDRAQRDAMVSFLTDSADEVHEMCRSLSSANGIDPPDGHYSLSVYLRPYLRWMYDLANEQLGCGRYRRSLEVCARLFELDSVDMVGVRFVAAYDYVKLEDAEGLAALIARFPDDAESAWFLLSRCFMAYKQRRIDDAAAVLHKIVKMFPQAGCTLSYQDELPPGVFGHMECAPGSEDELYVAVSEGAVILDENCGDHLSPLSDWVVRDPVVCAARAAEEARMDRADALAAQSAVRAVAAGASRVSTPLPAEEPSIGGFEDISCVDELLDALKPPVDPSVRGGSSTRPGPHGSRRSGGEGPESPSALGEAPDQPHDNPKQGC